MANPAAGFTVDALQDAARETYSPAEQAKAERTVKRFGITSVPLKDQVQLACAMKKLLGTDMRMSGRMFESWLRQTTVSTKIKRVFWVVPRASVANMDDIPPVPPTPCTGLRGGGGGRGWGWGGGTGLRHPDSSGFQGSARTVGGT